MENKCVSISFLISFILTHYTHPLYSLLYNGIERYKIVSAKQLEKGKLAAEASGKIPASSTKINIAPPAPGSESSKSRKCC